MFIDKLILFPYWLVLRVRHFAYDKGFIVKSRPADVPTVCIGNITAGGTGKTPHAEMILDMLLHSDEWGYRNIALLSRGYKRKSKGFQQVTYDGTASFFGDEPLQIKKKFPSVTVAVHKNRIKGCRYLYNPSLLDTARAARKCMDKEFSPSELIVLDDALQYRKLKPTYSIMLVDYNRPVTRDMLLPFGRLRDLPCRLSKADVIMITKCPAFLEISDREAFLQKMGYKRYDPVQCEVVNNAGVTQKVYFTSIEYLPMEKVFEEGDPRYIYSKKLVLFTGIAKALPLKRYLSDKYKVVKHLSFKDHHTYSTSDVRAIDKAASQFKTAVVATTEKDAQRLLDCKKVTDQLKARMFQLPIRVFFLSEQEKNVFKSGLLLTLRRAKEEKEVLENL